MIPVERKPSEVRKDGTKDLEDTPEPKTEPDGERSPREESYPDLPGKQGETGSATTAIEFWHLAGVEDRCAHYGPGRPILLNPYLFIW